MVLTVIAVISWGYFYQSFTELKKEANQTWSEHIERIENKNVVGEVVKAVSYAQPEEAMEDRLSMAPPSGEIEKIIYTYFKDDYPVAKAVFTAESGLQKDAQGWNCHYGTESRACAPEDREKAWSVDCGVAQINVIGKVCPQELFDPNHNLEVARNKYEARNWRPWSAYTSKKYLAFLNS